MMLTVNQTEAVNPYEKAAWGLPIALFVISLWVGSLVGLLALDISKVSPVWVFCCFLLRVFLSTGLFITAHDAMHGSVFPGNPKINHGIGAIALILYALFPYKSLLRKHHLHHRFPTGEQDPDFHENQSFLVWYLHFMQGYWNWAQFFGMLAIGLMLHWTFQVPFCNLLLFWLLPLTFSSLQLFCFGTFLPHRQPVTGYAPPYYSRSYPLPMLLSFLSCYHFGYHQEHHQYPQVPWWQLPKVYRQTSAS
jgi:beta-carotene/zeaxanthin 4-ketolase